MTAGAKIERIIALTKDYTQHLSTVRKNWQYDITGSALSTEKVKIPEYPTDEDFNAIAEAILYRIKGILNDSTI